MVWPGMNQVLGTSYSASRSTRRFAPTSPNSPRAIRFGDFDRRGPIHTEMASKSNVRQTETLLFVVTAEASHTCRAGWAGRRFPEGHEPWIRTSALAAALVGVVIAVARAGDGR